MTRLLYDQLLSDIVLLEPERRTLLATVNAERLLTLLESCHFVATGVKEARSALNELWSETVPSLTVHNFASEGEKYILGDDAGWAPLNPIHDNAIASVIYSCQSAILPSAAEAVKWATVQCFEAVDYLAERQGRCKKSSVADAFTRQTLENELSFQEGLLAQVHSLSEITRSSLQILQQLAIRSAGRLGEIFNATINSS